MDFPQSLSILSSERHNESVCPANVETLLPERVSVARSLGRGTYRIGYGLPCANCEAYFAADLEGCPYCGSHNRVPPTPAVPQQATEPKQELKSLRADIAVALGEATADASLEYSELGEQRERMLRDYKAKLYASHTQINPVAAFRCTLASKHGVGYESAAICKSCYNEAKERLEQMEAALNMEIREAALLIYEAVWADPTSPDPSRTYENAAHAILAELRRRAGLAVLVEPGLAHAH